MSRLPMLHANSELHCWDGLIFHAAPITSNNMP